MPSLPRPGDRLAGFRIERELGHGTTGTVYVAHQDGLDRKVALKVVGRPLAEDAGFRERFRREARTAAGLDHPNVVQILEAGEDDAHLWLAMRLVDGPDLRVLLRRTGRLEPAQAVAVVEQIAAALDAAHAAGLVHRDVKPSNVLIEDGPGRDLHVELADFGLARAPGVDDVAGTPGYAAPEQLAGAEAGPAVDVFGLGCVLFELLTGTPPPAPVEVPAGVPWRRGPGSDGSSGAGPGAALDGPAAASLAGAADDEPAVASSDAPAAASSDASSDEPAAASSAAPAAASSDAPAAPTVESVPTGDTGDAVGPSSADGAAGGTSTADGAAVSPSRVYGDRLPLTPSVALPRLGGAFDPAVQRATAADPADRFASAGELAMWARAALDVPKAAIAPDPADPVRAAAATPASPAEVGPAAPTWEIPPSPPRRRRGRKLLVAAFLAAVLGLLAAAFVFIGDLGDSSRGRQMGTTPTPQGPAAGAQAGGTGGATGSGGGSSAGSGGPSSGGAAGSGSGAGGAPGAATAAGGSGGSAGRAGGPGSSGSGSGAGRSGTARGGSSSGTGGDAGTSGGGGRGSGAAAGGGAAAGSAAGGSSSAGSTASGGGAAPGSAGSADAAGGTGSGGSAGSSSVPRAGRDAPTGATSEALPPIPAGASRFGGGTWVLDLPTAEGWRQTAVQELDGGARIVTRLQRPDAVRLVVESLPGRTAVVGVPGARTFPVRLPDAGRTDGALYRGGRYAMCSGGDVCAALPANGPSGGVLLIAGAHRAAGAKRIARRAASGLRVR